MTRKPQLSIKYLKKLFHSHATNGSSLTKDEAIAAVAELPEVNRRPKHFNRTFNESAHDGHLDFSGYFRLLALCRPSRRAKHPTKTQEKISGSRPCPQAPREEAPQAPPRASREGPREGQLQLVQLIRE
ncbi:hypothetical protein ANCCAN_01773 [Ancylostoma caninum]|uniref:EF-hand domain-containing protein n=1 Tax=Ancylostoma caninum TaxID=29170 RepID=A0A368H5W1_ANCCA|nr:hypothetical protein ANCCAN_01773 [Ancylostoma caninum]